MSEIRYKRLTKKGEIIPLPIISWFNYGNGTMHRITIFHTNLSLIFNPIQNGLFIGIERKGCFIFRNDYWLNAEYVAEKLNLSLGDAYAMADFINVQIGRYNENEGDNPRQQGNYDLNTMKGGKFYYEEYCQGGERPIPMINPCRFKDKVKKV